MIHRLFLLILTAAWALPASAAVTDIASRPLIVANPDAVKANLLFILDDSGSMNFDFLPDHVNDALCRSTGATPVNSGAFANSCCINGSDSTACWLNAAPFGTARGQPPFLAAGFNGIAYDPTIRYVPPVKADGSSWDSQTRAKTSDWTSVKNDAYNVQNTGTIDLVTGFPDTEWCVDDGTFSDCLRNDNYVLPGRVGGKDYTKFRATTASGSGKVATGAPDNASTADRKFGPHYYTITAAEYCTKPDLRNCSTTPGGQYVYPAPVRWCSSDAEARKSTPSAAACQATRNNNFSVPRFPTKFFSAGVAEVPETRAKATFTFTNNPSCAIQVTAVTVGGVNLMNASSVSDTNRNNLGNSIRDQIRAKSGTTGYTADTTSSGRTVIIYAPAGQASTATITLTRTPTNCTFPVDTTTPKFSGYAASTPATPGTYAGSFKRVDIHPDTLTYDRPATRTDCAAIGTSNLAGKCTYDEEMTNFANWWTYYHSRMQMMKSSASLAFNKVGNNRRVGYLSINNSTGKDYLNLNVFENTQRQNWFTKLTAAKPNSSTPLRTALSTAGRLFAGKLNGTTLNGTKVEDPVQYSCQRNAAILSTDGFWNEAAIPKRVDGTTDIGDVDSAATLDGAIRDGSATLNTLADVSYYYNYTDLRTTDFDNCKSGSTGSTNGNDVCGTNDPANGNQTMMTFTLGLGVSGYMQFIEGYLGGSSPDYDAVKNRDAANPGSGICSWLASGTCTWPVPASNTLTTVDDLWHAAVNGGGTYFSASSPTSLEKGLTSALQQFGDKEAAAAAATTSNPNVSAQDNRAFVSQFTSSHWFGELQSQIINLDTGKLESSGSWSAQSELDSLGERRILMSGGATTGLVEFKWSNVASSAVGKYFGKSWITAAGGSGNPLPGLTQFCSGPAYCLSDDNQAKAVGEALVNYLRGVRINEGELDEPAKYYRARKHLLGDIVNSEATYVNKALVKYADESHAEFQAKSRKTMVYVGANDGMLHAFEADSGKELWAYLPTAVMPKLYRLADKQYATSHQYFVDSTPFVQDIKVGSEWRTVLIGGLGAGGRAYYALDVTDPTDPKALWEFTNDNLGYTFGQPEIGKLRNGKWVAVLPSGYNNVNPGDGKGRIFVLDAYTGQPVAGLANGLATSAGSTTTPAGLGHIRGWVNDARLDNTIERVYGGDNLGNVWRFDINDNVGAAGMEALLLAQLKNADGVAQPVTSRPELGDADGVAMVFVGTGRYLGDSDLTDTTKQSVYGIKDALTAAGHGDVRSTGANFVQQTIATGTCPSGASWCKAGASVRTTPSPKTVNLAEHGGWYVDLPISSERVNTDPLLVLGTLTVISNVIEPGDLCKVGGSSWVNYFNYKNGQMLSTGLGNVLASRPTIYVLPNQSMVGLARGSGAGGPDGNNLYFKPPIDLAAGTTRRISWRDLLQQ